MRRSLFLFSLLASVPGLTWSQEPKLVNCRTLEAAGNFVGPDEVIVDDMVCQKAKLGTDPAKAQPPKPVIGTTISDTPADDVVGAAKAAGKRVAARKEKEEAEAQTNAAEVAAGAPPANATPLEPPIPAAAAPAAKITEAVPPTPVPPSTKAPPGRADAPALIPASAPSTTLVPAPAAPSPETSSSRPSPIMATPQAEVAATPAPAASAAEPTPVPSVSDASAAPPRPADVLPPPDPSHPATSGGFYDANAPKNSANAATQTNSGFATAEQVNAGLAPGATSIPPASSPSSPTEAAATPVPAAEAEPQHTTIAASRIAFDDPDRDRSVKLGDFAQPKEVSPDPSAEHRTSVDPSDADGFQDRQRPECTKNITLGGLKGERLVLGVPTWAAKWIEKNEKRMPEICFSETPMKAARNYLIVFSTPVASDSNKNLSEAVLNPAKGSGAAGVGTFTTSYGSTWHYSYDRTVGTTVLTQDDADEPHGQPGQVSYATAYTEEGVPVSQRWPGQLKKELKAGQKNPKKLKGENEALEHISGDLLSQMVEDIAKF